MSDPRWLESSEKQAHRVLRQALDEAPRWAHSEVRQRRLWTRVAAAATSVRATRRAFVAGALVASAVTGVVIVTLERVRLHVSAGDDAAPTVALDEPEPPATPPEAPFPALAEEQLPFMADVAQPGDVIRTGTSEHRKRDLRQHAHAELFSSSVLALDETGRPMVRKGQVRFQVAHQPPGERFTVRVGGYQVVVVGTRFVVSNRDGKLGVVVEEGTVEIWGDHRVARVLRGQSWSSLEPTQVATTPHPAHPAHPGVVEPSLAAARAETDPRRALELYATLARGEGPTAENALYEMGSIYQNKLGQPRDALASWEHYRARFPRGLLRAEADLSIVDTLASLGDSAGALAEATTFLKRYPQTERRGEVARVAGDLSRARGDCRAAVDFYATTLASRADAADIDDAHFGRAVCLHRQGDRTALLDYLSSHPRGRHPGEARRMSGLY